MIKRLNTKTNAFSFVRNTYTSNLILKVFMSDTCLNPHEYENRKQMKKKPIGADESDM